MFDKTVFALLIFIEDEKEAEMSEPSGAEIRGEIKMFRVIKQFGLIRKNIFCAARKAIKLICKFACPSSKQSHKRVRWREIAGARAAYVIHALKQKLRIDVAARAPQLHLNYRNCLLPNGGNSARENSFRATAATTRELRFSRQPTAAGLRCVSNVVYHFTFAQAFGVQPTAACF
jgi:hypothetical protein